MDEDIFPVHGPLVQAKLIGFCSGSKTQYDANFFSSLWTAWLTDNCQLKVKQGICKTQNTGAVGSCKLPLTSKCSTRQFVAVLDSPKAALMHEVNAQSYE
ncbi:hypothetical protein STEG23_028068, partial [Scotinomys teguina]